MTCMDCIHYDACNSVIKINYLVPADEFCLIFKNKANYVEVKHGEWLPDYEIFVDEWERESEPIQTGWVCSLCGRQGFSREPYCHCGARMDGERREQ